MEEEQHAKWKDMEKWIDVRRVYCQETERVYFSPKKKKNETRYGLKKRKKSASEGEGIGIINKKRGPFCC